MNKLTTVLVAIGVAAATVAPAFAQNRSGSDRSSQLRRPTYNQCYNLAVQRGLNHSIGDRWNLDWFIDQCLAGKIPF